MIRPATPEDFEIILAMCQRFWRHTRYREPMQPDHVIKLIQHAHSIDLLTVLEVNGEVEGFAAGLSGPLLGNADTIQVLELAYWINPGARGRGIALLRAFEKAARSAGAHYLNMVAMESSHPEIAERIYQRLGFEKAETIYTKKL